MIVEKFKIKTKQSKHYYTVLIFDTIKSMRSYFLRSEKKYEFVSGDNVRRFKCKFIGVYTEKPNIGCLLFCKKTMSYCDIAHELIHASFFYDEHINGRISMNYRLMMYEERFAVINDELTESFYEKLRMSINQFNLLKP